jgi:hypothetical protein
MSRLRRNSAIVPYKKDSSIYYSADADSLDSPAFTPAPTLRRGNLFGELVARSAQRVGDIVSHKLRSAVKPQLPVFSKPPRVKKKKSLLLPLPLLIPNPVPSAPQWVDSTGAPVPADRINYKNGDVNYPQKFTYTYNPKSQEYVKTVEPVSAVKQVTAPSGTFVMSKAGKKALRVGDEMIMTRAPRSAVVKSVRMAPAAMSQRMKVDNKPRISASSKGIVVAHREYMSNILSSSSTLTFAALPLVINPGKISTFPWLSTIAGNFDKYRIRKLVVSLVSNQPTTVAGRIGVGIDYDSTDPLPADRAEFFSLTHHVECSAWDSITFNVPLQGGERFVNSHTVTDSKLIDYGQIIIMSDQIVATSVNLGDVIVDYVVELIDPQQAIMLTMGVVGQLIASFDKLSVLGPVTGAMVDTVSTTVLQFKMSIGRYSYSAMLYDGGAGSPTMAVTIAGGNPGRKYELASANVALSTGLFTVAVEGALLTFTFGGVAISALETIALQVTRTSAVVETNIYSKMVGSVAM